MKRGILTSAAVLIFCITINSQTGNFTYQGKLTDGAVNANGTYQMRFSLYDAAADGSQIGATITLDPVSVTGGIFTVELNFTAPEAFDGSPRWLEIAVKRPSDPDFTTLSPRQPITSTPYSIKSLNADTAEMAVNSTQLGGVEADQFVITNDPRMSDARPPLAGSADYIQNRTTQQALSDFNVSGTGTANIFNAGTQYNIGGSRILSGAGNQNLFAGQNAGIVNTGFGNAFFGFGAGQPNTSGSVNSFFGSGAGVSNSTGSENSFFGYAAGSSNTTGCCNSFFGRSTGSQNTTGQINTFLGGGAGFANTIGSNNTFVGGRAGESNVGGSSNTMLGFNANVLNPNLSFATAIGAGAVVNRNDTIVLGRSGGLDEVFISGPTTIANALNVGPVIAGQVGIGTPVPTEPLHVAGNGLITGDLTVNGTLNANIPISGSYIQNTTSPQASSNFNVTGDGTVAGNMTVGSQTSQTTARLRVGVTGDLNPAILGENTSFGQFEGIGVQGYSRNNPGFGTGGFFIGGRTGISAESDAGGYTGLSYGLNAIATGTNGTKIGVIGRSSVFPGTSTGYGVWGVADGAGTTKYGVYGEALGPGTNWAGYFNGNTHVAGTLSVVTSLGVGVASPTFKLHVIDPSNTGLRVQTNTAGGTVASFGGNGAFQIDAPGVQGGRFIVQENGQVRVNNAITNIDLLKLWVWGKIGFSTLGSAGTTQLCLNAASEVATCSSSMRYKANVNSFRFGLDLMNRLRPVSFNWKQGEIADIGLVAEEVAEVEPLLVTYNAKGEVEGVKYDRIGVVLINAVKEQQIQITEQRELIESQQRQIDEMKRLFCGLKPEVAICKEEQKQK